MKKILVLAVVHPNVFHLKNGNSASRGVREMKFERFNENRFNAEQETQRCQFFWAAVG